MREGDIEYFCNCLLKGLKEHTVAVDSQERCLYCGHFSVKRPCVESDLRHDKKHGAKLEVIKREYLEMFIKGRRHNETIN